MFLLSFIRKYLAHAYFVFGIGQDAGDTAVSKAKYVTAWSLCSRGETNNEQIPNCRTCVMITALTNVKWEEEAGERWCACGQGRPLQGNDILVET